MEKEDLGKKVLSEIKEKEIKPKPKWQFTVKNVVFAAGFALLIALGSLAFSVTIFLLVNNDWGMRKSVSPGLLRFIFTTFPYLWITLFVVFLVLSYFIFRKIKGSYKFKYSLVVGIGLLAVIILGLVFYVIGFGRGIDHTFRKKMPVYHDVMNKQEGIWNKPEEGILTGKIVDISDEIVKVVDMQGDYWMVDIEEVEQIEKEVIKEGLFLRVVGEIEGEGLFMAEYLKKPPKGFFMKQIKIESRNIGERNIYRMRTI